MPQLPRLALRPPATPAARLAPAHCCHASRCLAPPPCSIVLAGLLAGGILRADPQAMAEWQEIQGQFKPPDDFRMKASWQGFRQGPSVSLCFLWQAAGGHMHPAGRCWRAWGGWTQPLLAMPGGACYV